MNPKKTQNSRRIISQFNTLDSRNDIGQLWENFIIIERIKKRSYDHIYGNAYFWRTYEQREIDLIEERDGKLFPIEIKWQSHKDSKPPKEWKIAYPQSESFEIINKENYLDFIS